ncbi:allophanate hydrolase subunit 1 [Mycolicibacterium goodii]|uniref:5-oxoprolinase subunit B family protein n=1 Tax=Mycolicibacterium goodii TaxID=134601 RepID=UPI001F04DBFB|nr:allophanate hydrolase subunit 1 [Mycolicibacterium goodii]ULN45482.1 allophanate hydrolase subunit 1 [Mycolicibacterium goodii]
MTVQQLSRFTIRPVGARAVLLELPTQQEVHRLANWLLHRQFEAAIEDVVPGARTVLIIARRDQTAIANIVQRYSDFGGGGATHERTVDIPVTYDGPDLDEVCAILGMSRAEFVATHTGVHHSVAFFGFTPGFAYIDGVPERLHVPRRANPRVQIAAGSVAIANGYTVIYPGGTPGGWNLIGHTTYPPLWDIANDPPNRLSVGDHIRFRGNP